MAVENLPIFVKSYDFILWTFGHTAKFPKSVRFSLAVGIENDLLEMLKAVMTANRLRDKEAALGAADRHLEQARILIRMGKDLRIACRESCGQQKNRALEFSLGRMLDLAGDRKAFQRRAEWADVCPDGLVLLCAAASAVSILSMPAAEMRAKGFPARMTSTKWRAPSSCRSSRATEVITTCRSPSRWTAMATRCGSSAATGVGRP